jgi:hypothetical protein
VLIVRSVALELRRLRSPICLPPRPASSCLESASSDRGVAEDEDEDEAGGGGSEEPDDAYTSERDGFEALRVAEEERS